MIPIDTMIPVTPARVSVAPWNSLTGRRRGSSRDPKMLNPMTAIRPERPVVEHEQDRHHHEGADPGDQPGAEGVLAERSRHRLDPFPSPARLGRAPYCRIVARSSASDWAFSEVPMVMYTWSASSGAPGATDSSMAGAELTTPSTTIAIWRRGSPIGYWERMAVASSNLTAPSVGELGVDDDPAAEIAADEPCLGAGQVLAGEECRADVVDQPVASLQVPLGVHVVDDGEPGLRVHVVRDHRGGGGRRGVRRRGGRRLVAGLRRRGGFPAGGGRRRLPGGRGRGPVAQRRRCPLRNVVVVVALQLLGQRQGAVGEGGADHADLEHRAEAECARWCPPHPRPGRGPPPRGAGPGWSGCPAPRSPAPARTRGSRCVGA